MRKMTLVLLLVISTAITTAQEWTQEYLTSGTMDEVKDILRNATYQEIPGTEACTYLEVWYEKDGLVYNFNEGLLESVTLFTKTPEAKKKLQEFIGEWIKVQGNHYVRQPNDVIEEGYMKKVRGYQCLYVSFR